MSNEDRIIEILTGNRTRARKGARRVSLLREQIRVGFRFSMLAAFQERYRLSQQQLRELVDMSERTVARRKQEQRLSKPESDRLYRVARVAALAEQIFGSASAAEHWLKEANPTLGNVTPLTLMDTDEGTQAVTDVLGRIEHGVYS